MKTKTILVIAVIALLGLSRTAGAQVTFGIKAGLNIAKIVAKQGDVTTKTDPLTSVHFGATAELPLSEELFVEPGLLLSWKGGKFKQEGDDLIDKLNYIEVPVNLKYKYSLDGNGLKVFGYAGPYIGYLLADREKQGNQSESFTDDAKKVDAGLNIGAGIEINAFTLGIQYGLGLVNLSNEEGVKSTNRVFAISVGYRFGSN